MSAPLWYTNLLLVICLSQNLNGGEVNITTLVAILLLNYMFSIFGRICWQIGELVLLNQLKISQLWFQRNTQHMETISQQFFMPRRSTQSQLRFLQKFFFGWCPIRLPYGYIGRYVIYIFMLILRTGKRTIVPSIYLIYSVVPLYASTRLMLWF